MCWISFLITFYLNFCVYLLCSLSLSYFIVTKTISSPLFSSACLLSSPPVFLPLLHCQTAIISGIKRDSGERNKEREWGRPVTFHLSLCTLALFFQGVHTDLNAHARSKQTNTRMQLHPSLRQQKWWSLKVLGHLPLFSFILHPPASLSMTVSVSPPLIMHSLSIDSATYSVAGCQATIQLYYCNWCVETLPCSMSTHSTAWLVHWLTGWLLYYNWWKHCQST